MGKTVVDRCNLVILFEKGQKDLAEFLAGQCGTRRDCHCISPVLHAK